MNPADYWSPPLAHWFHLKRGDMADLTAEDLMGCVDFIVASTKGR